VELVVRRPQILCFGEAMLELSHADADSWRMGVAGDTYNVAVYLKRLGCDTAFMTALGRDDFSADIKAAMAREGLGPDWCLTHPARTPGLYAIRLDEAGERSFSYWREASAARAFFDCEGAEALLAAASGCGVLYFSAITLSLFDDAGRAQVVALAKAVRQRGVRVAFDSNYRPRGWADAATAVRAIAGLAGAIDIALPTFSDDAALFGDRDPAACAARWHGLGASEVAVKLGADGAFLSSPDATAQVPAVAVTEVADTTGAGDSFNAGYLAARQAGLAPREAAAAGCRLAAAVIRHPGAIIPPSAMPAAAQAA
jgi:2-dehydro-3-deoxygluconokinase